VAVLALLAFAPSTVSAPPYVPPYTFVLPTLQKAQNPPPPPKPPAKRAVLYEVTAYTAGYESTGKHSGDALYGVTASGSRVKSGVTVACPHSLPFGTQLTIEGVGRRTCTDRGGAIKGRRIDVYIARLSDAQKFGRKRLAVTITKIGSDVK
jgi:3D (Asp-Asp-Asp) domain-containing protein